MEYKTLSQKIDKLRTDWKKDAQLLQGLSFNTKEIIDRIYFYKNDKFVECSDPNALFWQVVTPYVQHFAKMIDLDPKDYRPEGQGDTNFYQVWILKKLFNKWIQEENFSVDIDDMTRNTTAFGSSIWKIVDGEDGKYPELVDLRNVCFNQRAKSIRDTDFVEFHYLTEQQIREKEEYWDNIEGILKTAKDINKDRGTDTDEYEIWEYVGYDVDNKTFVHKIGAGSGDLEVIAFEEKIDKEDSPYYDFHLWEFDGRWLRKGVYETCFPEQERANTIVNENAAATSIASLLLLRSNDPNTNGNVLTQAVNGQIINSADLQQVGIDNRAFNILLNELGTIERQVQKKLMLPDIATGDNLPAGTPFRGMAVMSNAYKSAFKQIRNRVAQTISEILLEEIFPSLVKEWNKGKIIEIADNEEDVKMYDKALKQRALLEAYVVANNEGIVITPEDEQAIEQHVDEKLQSVGRKVEVEKGFFDFEYGITLDPTGETQDRAAVNDVIINALQMIQANPAITEVPAFKQLLESNGISPFKLEPKQQENIRQMGAPVQPPEPAMPQMPGMSLEGQVDA